MHRNRWRCYGGKSTAAWLFLSVIVAGPSASATGTETAFAPLDPNAELTDVKLSAPVAKLLAAAITSYNSKDYRSAVSSLDQARNLQPLASYDDFQIRNLAIRIEIAKKDYRTALTDCEAMAASPALGKSDKAGVYGSCLSLNVQARKYWRAIQYGASLDRLNLLSSETAKLLASTYFADGVYEDAERVAQAALANPSLTDKQRKDLTSIVENSRLRDGKRQPTFGEGFLNALISGAAAGIAEATTGETRAPPSGSPDERLEQARQSALAEALQAQQRAAAETLTANPSDERVVYRDLKTLSDRLSKAMRKSTDALFVAAFRAWQREDYSSALKTFRKGLDSDPANASANYYYADCLARQDNEPMAVIDYLARAWAFGEKVDEGEMARTALNAVAAPSQN